MRLFLFVLPFAVAGFLFGWLRVARAGRQGRVGALTWPLPILILALTPVAVAYLLLSTGNEGGDGMKVLAIILTVMLGVMGALASWVGALLGALIIRKGLP